MKANSLTVKRIEKDGVIFRCTLDTQNVCTLFDIVCDDVVEQVEIPEEINKINLKEQQPCCIKRLVIKKMINHISSFCVPNRAFPLLEEIIFPKNTGYRFVRVEGSATKCVYFMHFLLNVFSKDTGEFVLPDNTFISAGAFADTMFSNITAELRVNVNDDSFTGSEYERRHMEDGYYIFGGKLFVLKSHIKEMYLPAHINDISIPYKSLTCDKLTIESAQVLELFHDALTSSGILKNVGELIVNEQEDSINNYMANIFYDDINVGSLMTMHDGYVNVDDVLYTSDMKTLVFYPSEKAGDEFVIPYGVETIGEESFRNALNLKKVVMPDTVIYVEAGAFSHSSVSGVVFSKNLKYLGNTEDSGMVPPMFSKSNIKNINIPGTIKCIGASVFRRCEFDTVEIEDGVEIICQNAFRQSEGTSGWVTLPKSIKYIEPSALNGVSGVRIKSRDMPNLIAAIKPNYHSSLMNAFTTLIDESAGRKYFIPMGIGKDISLKLNKMWNIGKFDEGYDQLFSDLHDSDTKLVFAVLNYRETKEDKYVSYINSNAKKYICKYAKSNEYNQFLSFIIVEDKLLSLQDLREIVEKANSFGNTVIAAYALEKLNERRGEDTCEFSLSE